MDLRRSLLLCALLSAGGCIVGGGDGWVAGDLKIENCNEGQPLDRTGDFDLNVDFFAGEPVDDTNPSPVQRRGTLLLRLQNTSNNVEESNGLMLQFIDVGGAAVRAAAGEPVAITYRPPCPASAPCPAEDLLRARLHLFTSCPDNRQPLVGQAKAAGASCAGADRQALSALCARDFKDRSAMPAIRQVFGNGACLYLCEFGAARPGSTLADPASFRIDYGDRVAGVLSTGIVDGRAVEQGTTARAGGWLQGMFSFEVVRGQSAQSFP